MKTCMLSFKNGVEQWQFHFKAKEAKKKLIHLHRYLYYFDMGHYTLYQKNPLFCLLMPKYLKSLQIL